MADRERVESDQFLAVERKRTEELSARDAAARDAARARVIEQKEARDRQMAETRRRQEAAAAEERATEERQLRQLEDVTRVWGRTHTRRGGEREGCVCANGARVCECHGVCVSAMACVCVCFSV